MKNTEIVFLIFLFIKISFLSSGQEIPKKRIPNSTPISSCLTFVKDFKLSGSAKRFDYQSLDKERSLLFITHLGDNSVAVFDVKSNILIKTIANISRPHGILVVPRLNKVYVSATGTNEIVVLDENSLKIIDRIPGGYYPDGFDFDPKSKRLFVSDEHGKTVTVIDTQNDKVLKTIPMGGDVGNTHFDSVSGLIYTAVHDSNELIEIDPMGMKISARYKLKDCGQPHGFLIDSKTHYAFITGQTNADLVVFDLTKKAIIGRDKVGGDPDVLSLDKQYHLLYVSAESGVVTIFRVNNGGIIKICEGLMAPYAHTVEVNQITHQVYFPLQDIEGIPVLRVMEPGRLVIH